MLTFSLTLIPALAGTLSLGLLLDYTRNKPLGMQTLPDIALQDMCVLGLLGLNNFLVITFVHDVFGPIDHASAVTMTTIAVMLFFSWLIQNIMYQAIVYCHIYHDNLISSLDDNLLRRVTRSLNFGLTAISALIDIGIYGAG